MPERSRPALGLIFFIVFLDLLGVSILVPVLPFLVREYRTDAFTVGLLSLSFSAAQFFASPVLGMLSDRFGRRPVLLVSILGSAAGYFLFGFARSLWLLFLARVIDGISGGNISTAQAYIADVTPPEDRSKSFGLIGAAFGLGFILGPTFGGLLSKISLQAPAFAAGFLSLATCAAAYFLLPESLPPERRTPAAKSLWELDPLHVVWQWLRRPEVTLLLVSGFCVQFAVSALQTNFGVFALVKHGMSPVGTAALYAWLGLLAAYMQGIAVRQLARHFEEYRLLVFGSVVYMVGFMTIALVPKAWMLYPAIALAAVGAGLAGPTFMGQLSRRVSPQEQGTLLGVYNSVLALTRVMGPAFAGAVFDWVAPEAPYYSGALWLVAGLALLVADRRRNPHS
ncbi:MAG: MFS transporter [Bryobacter sp.]|jgi:multidrug resistance protein|nr:MFS transporter [Bryobacter sp.]